jgi:hypothetical protein
MIVELADMVSSRTGNIKRLTNQSTLFPAPAAKKETISIHTGELLDND